MEPFKGKSVPVIIAKKLAKDSQKTTAESYVVIAIVAALALFGVVAVTIVTISLQQQQAEAVGCKNSKAFNASKGRCFQP